MNKPSKLTLSPLAAMSSFVDGIRAYLRPVPELPPEAFALTTHFKTLGIDVKPKSIRPGKPGLTAVFDLRIPDYPLPIIVLSCQDAPTAERFLYDGGDRPRAFPKRNGRLVMYLPYWEEEDGLTKPVIDAFVSFRAES
jgi:hypothetical protein